MPAVDPEQHEVVFRVAVLGSAGKRFLEGLKAEHGELELAALAGYKSRFVFSLFSDDPWAGDGREGAELEEQVPLLDALVLSDDFERGAHYSSTAVERVAKLLSPLKLRLPSVVFGGPALAEEWQSLSGAPLLLHASPRAEEAPAVLKAIAKALLRSNIRSTPPPPSAH